MGDSIASSRRQEAGPEERATNEPGQRGNWIEATEGGKSPSRAGRQVEGLCQGKDLPSEPQGEREKERKKVGVWREENDSKGPREGGQGGGKRDAEVEGIR